MIIDKSLLFAVIFFVSGCSTAPSHPIAADPVVVAKGAGSYEITVTGLPNKRAIEVERGFHEVADDSCFTKGGWSGWKMAEGSEIKPVKNSAGVYVAKGQVDCSKS